MFKKWQKYLGLSTFLMLFLGVTAAAVVVSTTMPLTKFGPYFTSQLAFDSLLGGQAGGQVRAYLAVDSLEIGDYVYDTLVNKVARSATLLSYNSAAGIVVGGARTSMRPSVVSADVGTLAATANQRVLVTTCGRSWVRTADSVYAGNILIPGAVRGRLKRRTTAIDTFSRAAGQAIYPKDSGGLALINVRCRG